MKTNWFIAIGLLATAAIAFVVASLALNRRAPLVRDQRSESLVSSAPATSAAANKAEVQPAPIHSTDQAPTPEVTHVNALATNAVEAGIAQTPKPRKSKPPIQNPAARVALSLVGADAEAEEYWLSAINDSTLPANERKDLIEDLNEDGLTDPKHPSPDDMPLIWSRIRLIETLAPFAMDPVNANAFAEAYKDLVNLADGQPAN